ncbi:MAG: PD40 domain-containing protein, partial [Candidatus Omnitrophica bacterium]|nr:PD40 domain-containing protein [Candidatus Omnitrophota bacterium]
MSRLPLVHDDIKKDGHREATGQRGAAVGSSNENIEPTFSADGRAILFLSRRPSPGAVVIGSGWFWQIPVTGGEPKLVHREETLYHARPTMSPDGSRLTYISFRRGKNTLTVLPAGHEPGDTIQLPASGTATVTVQARVDSVFPMSTLSIIRNGEVVESL